MILMILGTLLIGGKTTLQGRAYIDSETGLLCVSIEEKYDKPKGKKVLVPFVCTTCGTTEWKTIENEE